MSVVSHHAPPDPSVWITKDGRSIPVRQMTDDHLINAIKMCRRKGFVTGEQFESMWGAIGTVQGEMAQYALEGELDGAKTNPRFDALVEEAARRGLDDRDTELDGDDE